MRSTNGKKPDEDTPPLKRATAAEKEARVVQAMKLVIEGNSTSQIKQWFRDELDIQFNQALRYLRLARERLAEDDGLGPDFTLEDMRVQHYAIAMNVVATSTDNRERLAALKLAGAMYGLDAPIKVAPTNPAGDKPYALEVEKLKKLPVEDLRALDAIRKRFAGLAQGNGNGAEQSN